MARHETNLPIPLPEGEALVLLGKVEPTPEMPRPGSLATKLMPKLTRKGTKKAK